MGSNIAQKRAAKAQRRKAIVEGKRKAEIAATGGSLAERVRRAVQGKIVQCAVQDSLAEAGHGMMLLVREDPQGGFAVANFLVDSWSGAKDVLFRRLDIEALNHMHDAMEATGPVSPMTPGGARAVLRQMVKMAAARGIRPHKDYAAVEALFGDVVPEELPEHALAATGDGPAGLPPPSSTNDTQESEPPTGSEAQAAEPDPEALPASPSDQRMP